MRGPGRQLRPGLARVIRRRPIPHLLPGGRGQHAQRVRLEGRAGKFLQQRPRVILRQRIVLVRQRLHRPEQEQVLQDGMRRRQADQAVQPPPEIGARRLAHRGPGQQLERDALLVAVGAVAQELAEGVAPHSLGGAGHQAQHQPGGVQLVALHQRDDRRELALQQRDRLGLAAERVQHGGVGARDPVADLAALKLLQVLALHLRLRLGDGPEAQARLLPEQHEARPGEIVPGGALGLLVKLLGAVPVVRRLRHLALQVVVPGAVRRTQFLGLEGGQLGLGDGGLLLLGGRERAAQAPGGAAGSGEALQRLLGLGGPAVVQQRRRQPEHQPAPVAPARRQQVPIEARGQRGKTQLLRPVRRRELQRVFPRRRLRADRQEGHGRIQRPLRAQGHREGQQEGRKESAAHAKTRPSCRSPWKQSTAL